MDCFLSLDGHKSRVPVVGLLIEGGHQTFRTVFELLTGRNPVPVVICDGSGRAADLLAFMYHYASPDGCAWLGLTWLDLFYFFAFELPNFAHFLFY